MHPEIKALHNISYDGDDWGHCMAFQFACADLIHFHTGGSVPEHWEYRPGLGNGDFESWPDSELYAMVEDFTISEKDLIQAGNVFCRYAECLRKHGKDY